MAKVRSINGEDVPIVEGSNVPIINEESGGVRLVTILYSKDRDLYRMPAIDKPCWLTVKTYELPATQLAADAIYLGPSISADGKHWRKAFSSSWRSILTGDRVAIPADDPMVMDYTCAAPGAESK